jgi:hypothetical protein
MTEDLQVRRLEIAVEYFGDRAQRMAAHGASARVVRDELRELAFRNGILALQAGVMPEFRQQLLEIADGCGEVFHAHSAVEAGLRRAERRLRTTF